jgi:hypothetical protein
MVATSFKAIELVSHCNLAKKKMAMFIILELDLVCQLEFLLQNLYAFLVYSLKKFLEFLEAC